MRIELSDREFHTVLAALRCAQARLQHETMALEDYRDIASNAGELDELDTNEIGGLCERLNRSNPC